MAMTPRDQSDILRTNSAVRDGEEPPADIDPPVQHVRSLREVEAEHVQFALRVSSGNKKRAAEALGISRDTLYRKIAEFGLAIGTNADHVKDPRGRSR